MQCIQSYLSMCALHVLKSKASWLQQLVCRVNFARCFADLARAHKVALKLESQ